MPDDETLLDVLSIYVFTGWLRKLSESKGNKSWKQRYVKLNGGR